MFDNQDNNYDTESKVHLLGDDELFDLLDKIDYEEDRKFIESMSEENQRTGCSRCKSADLIIEDPVQGFSVCSGCGEVVGEILDSRLESRNYGEGNEISRCSQPTNAFLPQSSLGTSIAGAYYSKIKTLHSWNAMPYRERSLNGVLKEIQTRCRRANILKCIEDEAKIFYKNISECQHESGEKKGKTIIIRGSNRRSLIAACVFYACLRNKKSRSTKEIAQIFDLEETDITKGLKTFKTLIKMKNMNLKIMSSTPEHFTTRYCKELKIKGEYADKAIQIATNIQRLNLASDHTPISVATGSILLMADMYDLPVTKRMIASKFDVSEVTVVKTFKKLLPYKNILVSDKKTTKLLEIMQKEREKQDRPQNLEDSYRSLKDLSCASTEESKTAYRSLKDLSCASTEESKTVGEEEPDIFDKKCDLRQENLEEYLGKFEKIFEEKYKQSELQAQELVKIKSR